MDKLLVASELVRIARSLVAKTKFESALEKAIKDQIKKMKKDGTTSMSLDNLMQVVRPPSSSLEGAPKGTNAQSQYKQMFKELVKGNRFVTASLDNGFDAEQLAKDIREKILEIFPHSFVGSHYSTNLGQHITIKFALGEKSEWQNGIIENDPAYTIIMIQIDKEGSMEIVPVLGFGLSLKPEEGSYYHFSKLKVPFRKTKVKPGDIKKVLSTIEKAFKKLKDAVKSNIDNFKDPEMVEKKV